MTVMFPVIRGICIIPVSLFIALSVLYGCIPGVSKADIDCRSVKCQCIDDRIVMDYPFSYEDTWDAVNTALLNSGLGLSYSYKDESAGFIVSVDTQEESLLIAIKSKNKTWTSVAIKDIPRWMCRNAAVLNDEIAGVLGIKRHVDNVKKGSEAISSPLHHPATTRSLSASGISSL